MAKTKTKPKTPKTPTALQQAQAETEAKYKPQLDMAQSLIGQAGETLKSDIETAKNNAGAITSFAEAEKAPTIERFKNAQTAQTGYEANAASALGGVGPGADIIKNAISGEQQSLRSRTEGAGTRASQALSDRQTSALAGQIAASAQARGDYRKTKKSLTDQIQSLVGQSSADTIARFGQLVEAEAERNKDINVAKIGAQAKTDVAKLGADTAAGKKKDAAAAKEEKRVGGIHKATGTLKQTIANITDRWNQLAGAALPKPNPRFDDKKPISDTNKPYLNQDNNPVEDPAHAVQVTPSANAIRSKIKAEYKVDDGLIHVALVLRSPTGVLDQKAIDYIQANENWRVPREWLPKSLTPKHLPKRYGAAGRGADTT